MSSYDQIDTRLAYGHMPSPGQYATTVTRPDLFEPYLTDQLRLIIRNHGIPITIGESETPIPLHFALLEGTHVEAGIAERCEFHEGYLDSLPAGASYQAATSFLVSQFILDQTARSAFFEGMEPPASTLVGVTALAAPEWLIEIEAIAVAD